MRANQSNEIFILTAVCVLFWQPVSAGRSGQSEAGRDATNFSASQAVPYAVAIS